MPDEVQFSHVEDLDEDDLPVPDEDPEDLVAIGGEVDADTERKILDAWLSADPEVETLELEIASWSRQLGAPFIVTVRQLTDNELKDIFSMFEDVGKKSRKGPSRRTNADVMVHIAAMGIVKPNINAVRGGSSPVNFLRSKFKPLEIVSIAEKILDLSGGGDEAVLVAKN